MLTNTLVRLDQVPDSLPATLDRRDVAVWIHDLPKDASSPQLLGQFLGLPWRLVLTEVHDPKAFRALEAETTFNDPMTRKRGFAQIIDSDPSRTELPQRCLPIYLLNGRGGQSRPSDFASRLRRMTMLEELRRSGVRDLLVLSAGGLVPPDLTDLWTSGFRCHLTFVSDAATVEKAIAGWLAGVGSNAALLSLSPARAIESTVSRFLETYAEERRVIRVRDV